jgi:hypothetical protein
MSSKQPSSADESNENKFSGKPIQKPHRHDVLSGRGNSFNNHPGNDFFRSLIKQYKVSYVTTPKSQKPKFSKMIYETIRAQDPPGRFLKQDKTTNLWYEISYRKAVDKTRQALREGAPEIKQKIFVSSVLHSAAAADGRETTKPDPSIICATDDTPMMIQNSSTSDIAAQIQELERKVQELQRQVPQNQQELMQPRQEYASIGTVANSNQEVSLQLLSFLLCLSRYLTLLLLIHLSWAFFPLMHQQQLMASMHSWSDIFSILMDPSFISSYGTSRAKSPAILSTDLDNSGSILGGEVSNISMKDFSLESNLNCFGQSTNISGCSWSCRNLGAQTFSENEELSDSSSSIGQLGENKNDSVAVSNNVTPLPQLPFTMTSFSLVDFHEVNQCQHLQQHYHPFTGGKIKEQQQQETYATLHSDLSPPHAMLPASEEANIQHLNQKKYFMKSGVLSRCSQMEEMNSGVNFRLKESNCNPRPAHIRGLPREQSLSLGNIMTVTEEKNVSMDDFDSALSKMLETSLDLDAVLSKREW